MASVKIADAFLQLVDGDLPLRVTAYDGSAAGPEDAPFGFELKNERGLSYLMTAPGDLGLGRAYVSGDLVVTGVHPGDPYEGLKALQKGLKFKMPSPAEAVRLATGLGLSHLKPPAPPPQEHLPRWRRAAEGLRHSRKRDREAIHHHYDVSNTFYEYVLGPSMTYTCAVFPNADATLEQAQYYKYDLVAQKLGLRPGMRLLDIGCGWGGMALHAARHYGAEVVGITLSKEQVAYASAAARDAQLDERVQFRIQDYRDVRGEQFDAISSIGMFEHVGLARLHEYFRGVHSLLLPGGRFLNHAISRPPGHRPRFFRYGFIDRYVFPDGELHEIGNVVSAIQADGFEVRHVESLREHYALTLRQWVRNLEAQWEEAEQLAGSARARIWQLYMAASALLFETGRVQIHQTLAVRADGGRSGMPLRPDWH
jgi:cyclopropane-fatty-acyl-phospholipid synthase